MNCCQKYYQKILKGILSTICLIFVIYQAHKCLKKFIEKPKSTEVSIQEASKFDYPDLTFCHADHEIFNEKLKACNLTIDDYEASQIWSSNNCRDPEKLYSDVIGIPDDIIEYLKIEDYENIEQKIDLKDPNRFEIKDKVGYFRCFTLNIPKNVEIYKIYVKFKIQAKIFVHSHGHYLNPHKDLALSLYDKQYITSDISYDTFIQADGKDCENYKESNREDCVKDSITKVNSRRGQFSEKCSDSLLPR